MKFLRTICFMAVAMGLSAFAIAQVQKVPKDAANPPLNPPAKKTSPSNSGAANNPGPSGGSTNSGNQRGTSPSPGHSGAAPGSAPSNNNPGTSGGSAPSGNSGAMQQAKDAKAHPSTGRGAPNADQVFDGAKPKK